VPFFSGASATEAGPSDNETKETRRQQYQRKQAVVRARLVANHRQHQRHTAKDTQQRTDRQKHRGADDTEPSAPSCRHTPPRAYGWARRKG